MMSNITNRKWFKNLKFIIICFLSIGGSLFCALHDFSNDRRGTNLIAHPIGWLGIGFFGYGFIFMLYKNIKYALQGRGMVAFTDEGMYIRDEFVAWENIVGIYGNKQCVIIDTNDTMERLRQASWWRKMNYKMGGAMITISNFDYDGSQEEFATNLKQQIELHQKQN